MVTVPCEGREVRFLHSTHRESNPGPSRGSPLHYHCATQAPLTLIRQIQMYQTYGYTIFDVNACIYLFYYTDCISMFNENGFFMFPIR